MRNPQPLAARLVLDLQAADPRGAVVDQREERRVRVRRDPRLRRRAAARARSVEGAGQVRGMSGAEVGKLALVERDGKAAQPEHPLADGFQRQVIALERGLHRRAWPAVGAVAVPDLAGRPAVVRVAGGLSRGGVRVHDDEVLAHGRGVRAVLRSVALTLQVPPFLQPRPVALRRLAHGIELRRRGGAEEALQLRHRRGPVRGFQPVAHDALEADLGARGHELRRGIRRAQIDDGQAQARRLQALRRRRGRRARRERGPERTQPLGGPHPRAALPQLRFWSLLPHAGAEQRETLSTAWSLVTCDVWPRGFYRRLPRCSLRQEHVLPPDQNL